MFIKYIKKLNPFNLFRGRYERALEKTLLYPDGKRYYKHMHTMRRDQIDGDAVRIVSRLTSAGHKAYVVGGSIRDLLLKKRPKDFDIATSAVPKDIRRLFRYSRIIGRRFKIVHVIFRGRKIIEVSTFRLLPASRFKLFLSPKSYMRKRDNDFGNMSEDAARRDFTINALFFDVRNECIIDYVGGLQDIEDKCLRVIGNPNISLKEDPIRILRAVKFAALHKFTIEPKTLRAVKLHKKSLSKVNKDRLLEELFKVFFTTRAFDIFSLLHEYDILSHIIPLPNVYSNSTIPFAETGIGKRFKAADKLISEYEELTTNIYLGLILIEYLEFPIPGENPRAIREYVSRKLEHIFKSMHLSNNHQMILLDIFSHLGL